MIRAKIAQLKTKIDGMKQNKKAKTKIQVFQFQPFSFKQKKVLTWWMPNSPVKDQDGIIADGAIRSGKTISMSLSFVFWAMATFNGQNFGMCGKTIGSFRRNVLFWLKLMLRSRGYSVVDRRADNLVFVTRGSVTNYFYIFGGKDERSQDLIQGITLAGVFFDEVALMPESFVNQATGRCSVTGSKYWFNCNPDGSYHWFKVNWIDKVKEKRLLYLHFTMDDNLSLSERIKERYRFMYTGVFFKRYILGLWVVAEGIIYDGFDEQVHTYDEPLKTTLDARRYLAIDYGTTNPMCFLEIIDDGDIARVNSEYYYSSKEHGRQKTDAEYAEDFVQFAGSPDDILYVVLDPSAASFKVELRNRGYRVKDADNDVRNGISKVSTMFALNKLLINKNCRYLIKELLSYRWDAKAAERGDEKPIKANDHACVTGDTIINTVDGDIRIDELVGKQGKVYCFDEENKCVVVSDFYDVRITRENAEVFEIELENGKTVKATADHKVLTDRGWKEVIYLTVLDKILDIFYYL